MDFKAEREKRGWTLAQVAAKTGYSIPTINGLELNGEGSYRLKIALNRIYGNEKPVPYSELESPRQQELREGEDLHHEIQIWKTRAKTAEQELHDLRTGLRALLEKKPASSKKTVAGGADRIFQKAKEVAPGASPQPAPGATPSAGDAPTSNPPTPAGRPQKKNHH